MRRAGRDSSLAASLLPLSSYFGANRRVRCDDRREGAKCRSRLCLRALCLRFPVRKIELFDRKCLLRNQRGCSSLLWNYCFYKWFLEYKNVSDCTLFVIRSHWCFWFCSECMNQSLKIISLDSRECLMICFLLLSFL